MSVAFEIPPGFTELLQEFTIAVLRNKPSNIVDFAVEYFKKLQENGGGGGGGGAPTNSQPQNISFGRNKKDQPAPTSAEDKKQGGIGFNLGSSKVDDNSGADEKKEGDDDDSDSSELIIAPPPRNNRRQSVAAESFDPEADDDDEDDKVIHPKSDSQRQRLGTICGNILLFKCLEEEDMDDVIDAMFERKCEPGDVIMTQGESGDNFYIVDSGHYDVLIEEKKVFEFVDSGSFGELALMYNCPRSATIVATSPGVLWAMDRNTFRKIVLKKAYQKRLMFEALLETVPLLKELSSYERMRISDALVSEVFKENQIIFRQDDDGNEMYFIQEGEVKITRKNADNEEITLCNLTKGSYFGELALVTKQKRAATVLAMTKVKVAKLDVGSFERLLGPCIEVMKRNFDSYNEQLSKMDPSFMR